MPEMYKVTPESPTFNVLLYGEPGSGKTTLAASTQNHPEMQHALVANIEGGLLSVAHRGDIHAVDIRATSELEALYWKLAKQDEEFAAIRSVVIDSGTELQTLNLEEIVKREVDKNHTSRSGKKRSANDVWQEDYGESTIQLKRLFRGFKDLPLNVIVTALAKFVYPKTKEGAGQNPDIEPLVVLPSITQKLGGAVMGYMDFVWYTFLDPEDGQYKMLTTSQGPYFAKTRGPRFAAAMGPVVNITEGTEGSHDLASIYDLFVSATSGQAAPAKKGKKTRTA